MSDDSILVHGVCNSVAPLVKSGSGFIGDES